MLEDSLIELNLGELSQASVNVQIFLSYCIVSSDDIGLRFNQSRAVFLKGNSYGFTITLR